MRQTIIAIILFATTVQLTANDTLSSKIKQATVFLRGAQIYRETKTINIKKGISEMIIKDVSPQLDPAQLQATALGNFLILDVQRILEYVVPSANKPVVIPKKVQKEIKALQDTMLFINFEKEQINSRLTALTGEKNMILKNRLMQGGGKSDSLPVLIDAMKFYRKKLNEINRLIHKVKRSQHYLTRREAKHSLRLNELRQFNYKVAKPRQVPTTRHHIKVTIYSEVPTTGKIKTNYLVPNAGWIPAYDLRADNVKDPMKVTYKAQVYQNSGEDWDNVKMVLSTYNQNCFTSKPTIGIWRLDYKIIYPTQKISPNKAMQFSQNFSSEVALDDFAKSGYTRISETSTAPEVANWSTGSGSINNGKIQITKKTYTPIQELTEVSQSFSNIEFNIKLPYSVKSDGQNKLMVVTQETIDADFYHYMLPRANKNGFLIAKISNWEDLNLLPGKANIYFKHTFVGQTQINPTTMADTMELALGRDMGIYSKRKKLKDKSKELTLSKYTLRTMTFEIELRNNTKAPIVLTLEDQIPITKNEDIKIELLDGGGADHAESTGMLTWKLKLNKGETRKVKFTYTVKFDKDKEVV